MHDRSARLRDADIGQPVFEWRRPDRDRRALVIGGGLTAAGLLVCGGLYTWQAWRRADTDDGLLGVAVVAGGVALAIAMAVVWANREQGIDVGQRGIERIQGRRRRVFLWDDIEAVRDVAVDRLGTRLLPGVEVTTRAGQRFRQHGWWELTAAIERGSAPAIAARATATIEAGGSVEFGPFGLSAQGVRHRDALRTWLDVSAVLRTWDRGGRAEIGIRAGRNGEALTAPLASVPNARAFAMLVREMTAGRSAYEVRSSGPPREGWEDPGSASAPAAPVMDASVEWAVIYIDTFDRDATPTEERRGRGLRSGLAAFWSRVLSEGVDDKGSATFSSFSLAWKSAAGHGRITLPVRPFGNQALAELRALACPPQGTDAAAPPGSSRTGQGERRPNVAAVDRIARIHADTILGTAVPSHDEVIERVRALLDEALEGSRDT